MNLSRCFSDLPACVPSAEDSQRLSRQVRELQDESLAVVEAARAAGGAMEHVRSTWDSYCEGLSSLQAWLDLSQTAEVCARGCSHYAGGLHNLLFTGSCSSSRFLHEVPLL